MADSVNSFTSLLPEMKDQYAEKMKRIVEKPDNSKKYYSLIKRKLKAAAKKK